MNHLIHIGYAKAGSTLLQKWLSMHPQIDFADEGIGGFRNVFELSIHAASPQAGTLCRATSLESLVSPHRFVGTGDADYHELEAHPLREAQARACRLLKDLFPAATILIVTRGFRAMLLSSYSQYVRTGGDLQFGAFCAMVSALDENWWDYDRSIDLYEDAFGRANLLVLPYELLRDDPSAFFGAITGRLRLEPGPIPAVRLNASVSPASQAWYPRFARLLRPLSSGSLPRRLYRRAAMAGRLAPLAALLQRIRPADLPDPAAIPEPLLRELGRHCERLRARPSYGPYLAEYCIPETG
jgi:hypothetical protein